MLGWLLAWVHVLSLLLLAAVHERVLFDLFQQACSRMAVLHLLAGMLSSAYNAGMFIMYSARCAMLTLLACALHLLPFLSGHVLAGVC